MTIFLLTGTDQVVRSSAAASCVIIKSWLLLSTIWQPYLVGSWCSCMAMFAYTIPTAARHIWGGADQSCWLLGQVSSLWLFLAAISFGSSFSESGFAPYRAVINLWAHLTLLGISGPSPRYTSSWKLPAFFIKIMKAVFMPCPWNELTLSQPVKQ